MKRLAVIGIAAIVATLVSFGLAPSASAYPELTCNVTVDRQVVNPGETFTATGTSSGLDASGQVIQSSDIKWVFTWNGVTKHRTGAVASASFTAPEVTHTRDITLTARTTSPGGSCERRLVITVIGASVAGPTSGGGLPNLGGPSFLLLAAGLLLLLVGSGTVVVSRRRGSSTTS